MTSCDHSEASLGRIEFPELLERVAAYAGSALGASLVATLRPARDRENSERLRCETEASAELLRNGIVPPAGCIDPAAQALERLEAGAVALDPADLRSIGTLTGECVSYRESFRAAAGEMPLEVLEVLVEELPGCGELSAHILRITTPDGGLAPKATPELSRLSAAVDRLRRKLSDRLSGLAEKLGSGGHLRDSPPTLRNGRYVLPVLSSHRTRVQGIVHDRSESGGTVFIEPMELVGEGNALQEAVLDMEQEARRILREATSKVREKYGEISRGMEALAMLDSIRARAAWHLDRKTVFPTEGCMSLPELRHPLIPDGEVVPSEIHLPEDWSVLLVSGPNAGGKSVLLKSIGLAVACAQSGLGVTASGESTMPHFSAVLVSMGDQQSIREHLSTYSARLTEQLAMVEELGAEGLALIDEPAAGTDPVTGAAMAISLMEFLASSGVRMVVSTHMGQLKNLASTKPGYYNGCMSFDDETLEPGYRFLFGLPGSSFTLDIARRMGYPDEILDRAVEMSGDSFRLDALMSELTVLRDSRDRELRLAREERERTEAEREHLSAELGERIGELQRRERELAERGRRILGELESGADSLMARLSRSGSDGRAGIRQEVREFADSGQGMLPEPGAPGGADAAADPEPGDWVTVEGWQGTGQVESVRKGRVVVCMGDVRLELSPARIRPSEPPGTAAYGASWDFIEESPEIHLRGLTLDEAIAELDAKMDNCLTAGITVLRIVHGKGRGILMRGIVDYLRADRRVRSWRAGEPAEGGTGVTVAVLSASAPGSG